MNEGVRFADKDSYSDSQSVSKAKYSRDVTYIFTHRILVTALQLRVEKKLSKLRRKTDETTDETTVDGQQIREREKRTEEPSADTAKTAQVSVVFYELVLKSKTTITVKKKKTNLNDNP